MPVNKVCSEPRCGQTRPCSLHAKPGGWARWKLTNHGNAYRGEWPKIRARVLAEEPRCRLCGAKASHVDHITPLSRGGTHVRSNRRALCAPCHHRVTGEAFGWSGRASARKGAWRRSS